MKQPEAKAEAELLPCSVIGCDTRATEKGMCKLHATRVRRNGTPFLRTITDRIRKNIIVDLKTNCWNWQKYKNEFGYGRLRVKGKKTLAHRASYQAYCGEIPGGLLVCHRCDNPRCVNPEHLFLGTNQDNIDDCYKKGRNRKGTPVCGGWSKGKKYRKSLECNHYSGMCKKCEVINP